MGRTKTWITLVLGCCCILGAIYIYISDRREISMQKEEAKEKIDQIETSSNKKKEGYLKIPSIALYQVLEKGDVTQLLSESKVAYWNVPDSKNIHFVGHRIPAVFASLERLEKGEIVELYWNGVYGRYRVSDFQVVNETEFPSFPSVGNLVLITCMEDDSKRLIVLCEKES